MKQIYIIVLAVVFNYNLTTAQCITPITYRDFGFLRSQLIQTVNPSRQFQLAMDIAKNNCFSAAQVEDLASLLHNDRDRLDFCKTAFYRTVDKENFEDVYDAFISFSNALRLYKFVNQMPPQIPVKIQQNPNVNYQYNYPNVQQYNGRFGCNGYINDVIYNQLKQQIIMSGNEVTMYNMAKNFTSHYCMTVAQIIEIAGLFNNDNYRFDIIQAANTNLYDLDNFTYFDQVFTNPQIRENCRRIYVPIPNQNNPPVTLPPALKCEVNNADLESMISSIEKISFNSSKESQLKSIARGRCFTVGQIRTLLNLYSFESSKLELAKFMYEFCLDKKNYFQINDVFSFSSSTDDLNKFIQTK